MERQKTRYRYMISSMINSRLSLEVYPVELVGRKEEI